MRVFAATAVHAMLAPRPVGQVQQPVMLPLGKRRHDRDASRPCSLSFFRDSYLALVSLILHQLRDVVVDDKRLLGWCRQGRRRLLSWQLGVGGGGSQRRLRFGSSDAGPQPRGELAPVVLQWRAGCRGRCCRRGPGGTWPRGLGCRRQGLDLGLSPYTGYGQDLHPASVGHAAPEPEGTLPPVQGDPRSIRHPDAAQLLADHRRATCLNKAFCRDDGLLDVRHRELECTRHLAQHDRDPANSADDNRGAGRCLALRLVVAMLLGNIRLEAGGARSKCRARVVQDPDVLRVRGLLRHLSHHADAIVTVRVGPQVNHSIDLEWRLSLYCLCGRLGCSLLGHVGVKSCDLMRRSHGRRYRRQSELLLLLAAVRRHGVDSPSSLCSRLVARRLLTSLGLLVRNPLPAIPRDMPLALAVEAILVRIGSGALVFAFAFAFVLSFVFAFALAFALEQGIDLHGLVGAGNVRHPRPRRTNEGADGLSDLRVGVHRGCVQGQVLRDRSVLNSCRKRRRQDLLRDLASALVFVQLDLPLEVIKRWS